MWSAFRRHLRFYSALAAGLAAAGIAFLFDPDDAPLIGGDVFYLVFLILCVPLARQKAADLKRRARDEDEGIGVVLLILGATILFFFEAVFAAVNHQPGIEALPVGLAALGALLGWFVLHTAMALHYADLHYFGDNRSERDLEFPGKGDACPWDFLYFSFVIGMTAQVSDVQVKTTAMRRTVLWHSIVSFFFNTVFIAMAVNAAVAMAS
jgi:uncharacterized membrane protein